MKVLVIAHGHPDESVGGAELAAYGLFEALKDRADVSEATFLARTDRKSVAPGSMMLRRENEYVWRQGMGDWFKLTSQYPTAISTHLREFLERKRPDIVFAHHYAHMGVEILREIRRTLPNCRLVLTLHEFVAICNRNGQMVKNGSKRLCYRESIDDCNACFPEISPQDFWLRKHFIQRHFEFADHFVSPSDFLRQRYIAWGIPEHAISVIENGQPSPEALAVSFRPRARNRLAFFGQITEYKGVDVLLQAMNLIHPETRAKLSLEIHGANLEGQGEWFRDLIDDLKKPLLEEGTLRWMGAYDHRELKRKMSKVDWIIVPSIWWENSPMVIQEAFVCRRPVICSNIGGMAEKVQDGVNGLHFDVRNPLDLGETLVRAATEEGLWEKLSRGIHTPPSHGEAAEAYLRAAA